MLFKATRQGVVNVAQYYHHKTVQVRGTNDDIRSNVRGGLNIMEARNYRPERSVLLPSTSAASAPRKRPEQQHRWREAVIQPSSKRSCSASPTKAGITVLPNRVHRRIILRDYGKAIYKASSRSALLTALEGCITGPESLREAGFLHRHISINNLMINEDDNNFSWVFVLD